MGDLEGFPLSARPTGARCTGTLDHVGSWYVCIFTIFPHSRLLSLDVTTIKLANVDGFGQIYIGRPQVNAAAIIFSESGYTFKLASSSFHLFKPHCLTSSCSSCRSWACRVNALNRP